MSLLDNLNELLGDEEPEKPNREDYIRAPFGWPGGKWRSLQHILPELKSRRRRTFVEGCGGSGIIIINMPRSELEVFNDRHSGVVAFYRVLREQSAYTRLVDRLKLVVHSREEFVWCRETWQNCTDDIERAARWYYMLRTSFSQLGRNFARATRSRDQIGNKLQRGLSLFPIIHERFRTIQVENLDVLQCIKDYDSHETLFYIDPDYIGADSGIYKHKVQHRRLLELIFNSKGTFVVSNYPNELYDSYPWQTTKTWEVLVTMTASAFTEENHLAKKRDVMNRQMPATEKLYIKE